MPCAGIGDEDDDFEPKWWNQLSPVEKPDDPSSFMYKFSNVLGDAIDAVSNFITSGVIVLSSVPVNLLTQVLGRNPFAQDGCDGCDCHN